MTTRSAAPRVAILVIAAILFAVPILASAVFGFSRPGQGVTLAPLTEVIAGGRFWPQLTRSLVLAVLATACSLLLLVPTLLWLHLKLPRALGLAEALSVLPMVIPAVSLVNGANLAFRATVPAFLTSWYSLVPFYVVLSMPLVYRALDAGMRALDLRTLTSAAASLGAGRARTLIAIILPNMRSALLTATMLSTTMALGEFAVAQLLLHSTFPVFLAELGRTQPRSAAAFSFLTVLASWLLLALFTRAGRVTTPRRTAQSAPTASAGAPERPALPREKSLV